MAKIEILTFFGALFLHFCPDKFVTGGANLRAKFHVYRGNVSPLWGEKPIFGPLSETNTSMAALRAGLPVTKNITLFRLQPARDPRSPPYFAQ